MTRSPPEVAQDLFAPLPPGYERWARVLSLGQDGRWRRRMVDGLRVMPGTAVLDIAAGTGSITRLLQDRRAQVLSLDQSREMLAPAVARGATGVVATAEALPFPDASFEVACFGYLLRYVDDVPGCMREICRVLRPGGRVGMVEFGRPAGPWLPMWWAYTRLVLPLAGLVAGEGWYRVGKFLGPSINDFSTRYPPRRLAAVWEASGLSDVKTASMSLGGGLVMWGTKDG